MGLLFVLVLSIITTVSIYLFGYPAWLMILLGLLWLTALVISFLLGHQGFGGHGNTDLQIMVAGIIIAAAIIIPKYNARNPCNQARIALGDFIKAENEYFSRHNTYTTNINLLKFKPGPDFHISVTRGDEQSFAVAISHSSCDENMDGTPDVFTWDSATR